jgi:signal transduction histidine kinase
MGQHGLLVVTVIGFAGVCTVVLVGIGIRYQREQGSRWFAATMGWVSLWLCSILALLLTDRLATEVVLYTVALSFSQATPVFWFCFVLAYTGHERWLRPRRLGALFLVPLVMVVTIWTDPLHGLYMGSITDTSLGGSVTWIDIENGPAGFVGFVYVAGLFVVGLSLVLRMLWIHDRLFSGQAVWLLCGSLAPIAAALAAVLGLLPQGVPLLSASFAVTGISYGYGLFRHRLLDLTPAARRIGVEGAFGDIADGVVILDRDRDVVAINESARQQFDCRGDAVLGESVETIDQALGTAAETDEIVDVDREGRILEVSSSVVEDSRGRLTGYTLSIRDVTQQRHRKQRLEVLNRVLRHNLRNDMTIVKGFAEALAEEEDSDRAQAIVERSDELLGRADKAREIERAVSGRPQYAPVEIRPVIDDVVDILQQEHPDASVVVSVPEGLQVVTEASTLELVLRNLVENAIEHGASPAGDNTARVRATRSKSGVAFTVSDDGPGIPQNEIDVLETTESALNHGSGLGLWLVYWGSARLGGDLAFDVDDGTTVKLSILDEERPSGRAPSSVEQ